MGVEDRSLENHFPSKTCGIAAHPAIRVHKRWKITRDTPYCMFFPYSSSQQQAGHALIPVLMILLKTAL
jgi:hypothetical protein